MSQICIPEYLPACHEVPCNFCYMGVMPQGSLTPLRLKGKTQRQRKRLGMLQKQAIDLYLIGARKIFRYSLFLKANTAE